MDSLELKRVVIDCWWDVEWLLSDSLQESILDLHFELFSISLYFREPLNFLHELKQILIDALISIEQGLLIGLLLLLNQKFPQSLLFLLNLHLLTLKDPH